VTAPDRRPGSPRIRKAGRAEAKRQGDWIAAMEPWRGMGYRAEALGRWLGRKAAAGQVWLAVRADVPVGILVCQPEVLLGSFISLLAVPPSAAGQGIGRALVDRVGARVFRKARWLYTSSDEDNIAAARFYRAMGFQRVGRLPDLVVSGRTEILWRKSRPPAGER
jgi:ribosomal protein S18 acetylase RimI-like enzyme